MPRFSSKVKSKSSMAGLLKKLKALESYQALAGYDDRPHDISGIPLAEVAARNEFGLGVNERPFMSQANSATEAATDRMKLVVRDIIYNKYPARESLEELSEDMAQTIREVIERGHFIITDNDQPLQFSEFMKDNTIGWVEKKGD